MVSSFSQYIIKIPWYRARHRMNSRTPKTKSNHRVVDPSISQAVRPRVILPRTHRAPQKSASYLHCSNPFRQIWDTDTHLSQIALIGAVARGNQGRSAVVYSTITMSCLIYSDHQPSSQFRQAQRSPPFAILSFRTTFMRPSACFSSISTYGFNDVFSQSETQTQGAHQRDLLSCR